MSASKIMSKSTTPLSRHQDTPIYRRRTFACRTYSPSMFNTSLKSLSNIEISPVVETHAAIEGQEMTPKELLAQDCETPVFKKNPTKHVNSGKIRKMRRLTMFKVPNTPPASFDCVSAEKKGDLNRNLSINLILAEIGMQKYTELFMKEEFNIPAFLTLNEDDMKSIGITDPDDLKILLGAVVNYAYLK